MCVIQSSQSALLSLAESHPNYGERQNTRYNRGSWPGYSSHINSRKPPALSIAGSWAHVILEPTEEDHFDRSLSG